MKQTLPFLGGCIYRTNRGSWSSLRGYQPGSRQIAAITQTYFSSTLKNGARPCIGNDIFYIFYDFWTFHFLHVSKIIEPFSYWSMHFRPQLSQSCLTISNSLHRYSIVIYIFTTVRKRGTRHKTVGTGGT